MRRRDLIVPGPGVSRVTALSAYLPALRGTPGDTAVYVLEGRQPGGTVLVLGGTHGDEPAGYIAAVVLVERARVERGRLIVVPRANESGFTHNVPQEGHPQQFAVDTPGGPRRFTFGARATNPVHQWPDPQVYTLASGQALSGSETRNLNRAYPGRADGTLTERVAFAITTLIRTERVDLALDLHEASPEYPVVNTIVAHQRATDLAALANLGMQAAGVEIGLEASPETLRGLSHREWGDTTPALAVLMETTNPAEGRLRGRHERRARRRGTRPLLRPGRRAPPALGAVRRQGLAAGRPSRPASRGRDGIRRRARPALSGERRRTVGRSHLRLARHAGHRRLPGESGGQTMSADTEGV